MYKVNNQVIARTVLLTAMLIILLALPLIISLTTEYKTKEANNLENLLSKPVNEITGHYDLHQHQFQPVFLHDKALGVQCQGLKLDRFVEYYYYEKNTNKLVLLPNPKKASYLTEIFAQNDYLWGPFSISQGVLETQLSDYLQPKPVLIIPSQLPDKFTLIKNSTLFYGKNPQAPEHGDLVLTYSCKSIDQLTAVTKNVTGPSLEIENFHKIFSEKSSISTQIKQLVLQENLGLMVMNLTQIIAIALMSIKIFLYFYPKYLSLILKITHNNFLILALLMALLFIPENKFYEMEYFAALILFFGLRSVSRALIYRP